VVRVAGDSGRGGAGPTPPDSATVGITLQPVAVGDAVTQSPSGASADSRGRFTLAGVPPGRYRLAASLPGASRWALRSAVVDGVDTLDEPFTVHPNQNVTGASITVTDRMARLSGTLRAAASVRSAVAEGDDKRQNVTISSSQE